MYRDDVFPYISRRAGLLCLIWISLGLPITVWYWRLDKVVVEWWKQLTEIQKQILGILILTSSGLTLLGLLLDQDIPGIILNLATELLGAAITFVLIDIVLGRIQKAEEERRAFEKDVENLKHQLVSGNSMTANIAAQTLTSLKLHRTDALFGLDLKSKDLREVDFDDYNFKRVNFRGSELQRAKFRHANLVDSNFNDAKLTGALFSHSILSNSTLLGSDMRDAVLDSIEAQHAIFVDCNLQRANVRGANLVNANFTNADLRGSDFSHSNICGVDFTDANLDGVVFSGVIFDQNTILPDGSVMKSTTDIYRFAGNAN